MARNFGVHWEFDGYTYRSRMMTPSLAKEGVSAIFVPSDANSMFNDQIK